LKSVIDVGSRPGPKDVRAKVTPFSVTLLLVGFGDLSV
jgi:hypothetical protein